MNTKFETKKETVSILSLFNNLALRIKKRQLQILKINKSFIKEMRAFKYTKTAKVLCSGNFDKEFLKALKTEGGKQNEHRT